MTKEKSHHNCKYFGYKKCPNINDEIMKRAMLDMLEVRHGGSILMTFPSDEDVDKICAGCTSFTLKRRK